MQTMTEWNGKYIIINALIEAFFLKNDKQYIEESFNYIFLTVKIRIH